MGRVILAAGLLALIVPMTGASPVCAGAVDASACCKRCKAGKPCGDSCIGKDKHCDKPKGCACQG